MFARSEYHVAAHAGREVDHNVDVSRSNAIDDLAIEMDVPRSLARIGIANVDMSNRGARARRLDRRLRDLLWSYGNAGMSPDRVAGSGYRTCNEDFMVHVGISVGRSNCKGEPRRPM
jgi:hypothetical protein